MCCAEFIVKYVLFFFNFLLTLAGLILIGAGVLGLFQLSDILELIPINIELIPISLLVLGSIVFLIAFCGCCGAIREARCLLIMYVVSMLVIGILFSVVTALMFRAMNNIEESVQRWLTDAFQNPNLNETFHVLETAFRCCGTTGADSYQDYYPIIPPTCCEEPIELICDSVDPLDLYKGCNYILSDYITLYGNYISYGLFGVIGVVVIAVIFGLFLNARITQRNRKLVY